MTTVTFTTGNDTYSVTSAGNYQLSFVAGDDTLTVNGGTSTNASMGDGNDVVRLRSGLATVSGGLGLDRFEIWASSATANGGGDADLFNIRGGSNLSLLGDDGADRFNLFTDVGGTLRGGTGNDLFFGYGFTFAGSIYGDAGNDYFEAFSGAAPLTIYGGTGNDTYRAYPGSPATFVEIAGEGTDTVQLARGQNYVLPDNIENLTVVSFTGSSTGTATVSGNGLNNTVRGFSNSETISGLAGNDALVGFGGNDTLNGDSGNDRLNGGAGNDQLNGGEGNDSLVGGTGDDVMTGGAGNDLYYVSSAADSVNELADQGTDSVRTTITYTLGANVENGDASGTSNIDLTGNSRDNHLVGNSGINRLEAGAGNDTVIAGYGDDYINGSFGNDVLFGGYGNDEMWGDSGNDVLCGGPGADTLWPGPGNNILHYNSDTDSTAYAMDHIRAFNPSGTGTGDVIDLTGIDANTSLAGNQAFVYTGFDPAAHSLWFTYRDNGDGTIEATYYADVDGDAIADFQILVHQSVAAVIGQDILL